MKMCHLRSMCCCTGECYSLRVSSPLTQCCLMMCWRESIGKSHFARRLLCLLGTSALGNSTLPSSGDVPFKAARPNCASVSSAAMRDVGESSIAARVTGGM